MKYGKSKGKMGRVAGLSAKMRNQVLAAKSPAKMTAPAEDTSSADTMQAIDKAATKARAKRLAGYQL